MEKYTFIIGTRNHYEFETYRDIFKRLLGGAAFATKHKKKERIVDGAAVEEDYYTLAAKVDKKTEDILRNEIRLSHFPIYGKTHIPSTAR